MVRLVFLVPLPLVRRWRKRIVAKVDSIGLVVRRCFQCSAELTEDMVTLRRHQVTPEELARAADLLDGPWGSMSRPDQRRVLRHLLQRIDCEAGTITVTFNAAGIKTLAAELMHQETNP